MSESNCRGWEIVSSAKKGQYRQYRRLLLFTPGFNRVVLTTSSYSQNRFNGFHPRDTDKALNEKKSVCSFWTHGVVSRKEREGGPSPPSH